MVEHAYGRKKGTHVSNKQRMVNRATMNRIDDKIASGEISVRHSLKSLSRGYDKLKKDGSMK